MGEAPESIILIQKPDNVSHIDIANPDKVAVITQTTLSIDDVNIAPSDTSSGSVQDTWNDLYIGKTGYSSFNGKLDDVRIYNYELSDEQVSEIYNGGLIRFK